MTEGADNHYRFYGRPHDESAGKAAALGLRDIVPAADFLEQQLHRRQSARRQGAALDAQHRALRGLGADPAAVAALPARAAAAAPDLAAAGTRLEEHTSELQSHSFI